MDSNERITTTRVNKIYKNNKRRLKIDEDFKINAKTVALAVGGTVVLSSLIITPVVASSYISDAKAEKQIEKVNNYEEQKYLANKNDEFFIDYKNSDEKVERLTAYVDISEKLNDLNLDKYPEITCFDDAIIWKEPDKVEKLIADYKENKKSLKSAVGDDVITFNHQVYELKELEKMYNEKVYNGYEYLEDYGLASTKSYLSDIYGGKPEEYKVQLNDYQHDGYKEITGPGITNKTGFDGDVLNYVDTLASVYKADNAAVQVDPETYNHDRNKAIAKAVSDYNKYGANIIEDIEKQNKHK